MTLAVFDLCDTLYSVNTTQAFIAFHANRTSNARLAKIAGQWTDRSSPWFWIGAAAHRLGGRDIARAAMASGLRGEAMASLRQSAGSFVTEYLPTHANEPIMRELTSHRQAGDHVVIATSSIDIVAEAVASHLGVEAVASTSLSDAEGRFCGLASDLTGRKLEALAIWRQTGEAMTVYSDNRTDIGLLVAADVPIVVIPSGKPTPSWAPEGSKFVQL